MSPPTPDSRDGAREARELVATTDAFSRWRPSEECLKRIDEIEAHARRSWRFAHNDALTVVVMLDASKVPIAPIAGALD